MLFDRLEATLQQPSRRFLHRSLRRHAAVLADRARRCWRWDSRSASSRRCALPALDVILVQSANAQKPDKADFRPGKQPGRRERQGAASDGNLCRARCRSRTRCRAAPGGGWRPRPYASHRGGAADAEARRLQRAHTEAQREMPRCSSPRPAELIEKKVEMARLAEEIQRESGPMPNDPSASSFRPTPKGTVRRP